MTRRKFVFFSILPCLLLLLAAEIGVRVAGLASPSLRSVPTLEEEAGLYQFDDQLFWSLRPGFQGSVGGAAVTVSNDGLRGPEVGAKGPDEFRVLSLGESTTFGSKVDYESTYASVLERLLNENHPQTKYRVINAGVPAYSSFQSLKFLETRGLELRPDLVLFYHELNDYLPSSLRDSSNTEIGIAKTDRQLYASRLHSTIRRLTASSALAQLLQRQWSLARIKRLGNRQVENPTLQIGLPDLRIKPRVFTVIGDEAQPAALNEIAIGRRVSDAERVDNLREVAAWCKQRGIALVIIHPSYRDSVRHECVLTRVCKENDIHTFEAYDALHPDVNSGEPLFLDSWHPSPKGHRLLAEKLYHYLTSQKMLR